jgi:parallel beta-helix repeat protein
MRRHDWILMALFGVLTFVAIVMVTPHATAWQTGDVYSGSGNWNINNPTVLAQQTVTVTGNVNINNGGSLTVCNGGITFSPTYDNQYSLALSAGGAFYFYDSTLISSTGYHYGITLRDTAFINRSTVAEMYGSTGSWVGGIQVYSSKVTIGNSTIRDGYTGGIYVSGCNPDIEYNTIYNHGQGGSSSTYCYGIYTTSTNGIRIHNNNIYNCYYSYYGYYYYGNGLRMDYAKETDLLQANNIHDNGFPGIGNWYYAYGADVYLYYSSPVMLDNLLSNSGSVLYLQNSYPPKIFGGTWDCNMPMYAYTAYQIYASSSTANISNVNITIRNYYYGYGTQFTNSIINMTNLTFTYAESGVYGYAYFYGLYVQSNSIWNINNCNFVATVNQGYYFYYFYPQSSSVINFNNSKFTATYSTPSYSYYFFPIYIYDYNGAASFVAANSTLTFNDNCGYTSKQVWGAYVYGGTLELINSTFLLNEGVSMANTNIAAIYAISNAKVIVRGNSTVKLSCNNVFAPAYTIYADGANLVNITGGIVQADFLNYASGAGSFDMFYLSNSPFIMNRSAIKLTITNTPGIGFRTFNTKGSTTVLMTGCTVDWKINAVNCEANGINLGAGATVDNFVLTDNTFNLALNAQTNKAVRLISITDKGAADFRNNKIVLTAGNGVTADFTGIYLYRSNPKLTNNTITSNVMQLGSGTSVGIKCEYSSNPEISNCNVSGNTYGVYASFFSMPYIKNCNIDGNKVGVQLEQIGNISLEGSKLSGNQKGLVCVDESGATLTDTVFQNTVGNEMELDLNSHILALNTTFNGQKLLFGDSNSTLTVAWWLGLTVQWQNGQPIPAADVVIKNAQGTAYLTTTTSYLGVIPKFLTTEYVQTKLAKNSHSPYSVVVTKNGLTGSQSVVVDASKDVIVKITDDINPEIVIVSPQTGILQNYTGIDLRGTASDKGAGLKSIKVSRDGTTWLTIEQGAVWETQLTLLEGKNNITAKAEDAAGNVATTSIEVNVDITPPSIEVISPANGSLTKQIIVRINGTTEDGSVVTVDGMPATVTDTSFTITTRLTEGTNVIQLFARDKAGNTNTGTWTLLVDITSPPLEITSPRDGLLTTNDCVQVTGTTEPGAKLTVNGKDAKVDDVGKFMFEVALVQGDNLITVVASDIAGNSISGQRRVELDSLLQLKVTSPQEGLLTNLATVVVTGMTDTDATVKLNDGLLPLDREGMFTSAFTLVEGLNILTFVAMDDAGNMAEVTVNVRLDTSRPPIGLEDLQNGIVTSKPDITFTGRTESGANVTVNGKDVPVNDGKFQSTVQLAEGANLITIIVTDSAGNSNSYSGTVTRDTSAPSLELIQPDEGFRTLETSVVLVGITEPGAKVKVNGTSVSVDAYGKFTTTVPLLTKNTKVVVTAEDAAGNSVSKDRTIVRTSKPDVVEQVQYLWAASGLLMAMGIMFPLTVLVIDLAKKRRRQGDYSQQAFQQGAYESYGSAPPQGGYR